MTSDEITNFWVDAPYNDRIPSLSPYRQYSTVRLSFPRPDEFSRLVLERADARTLSMEAVNDFFVVYLDSIDKHLPEGL